MAILLKLKDANIISPNHPYHLNHQNSIFGKTPNDCLSINLTKISPFETFLFAYLKVTTQSSFNAKSFTSKGIGLLIEHTHVNILPFYSNFFSIVHTSNPSLIWRSRHFSVLTHFEILKF